MKQTVNILAAVQLPEGGERIIKDVSGKIRLTVVPSNKPEDISAETWENTDILYTASILPNPGEAPELKWVQFQHAGIDTKLDHPLFQKQKLLITTMSGAITSQIAEYVLMAILALGQKLPQLQQLQREHLWPGWKEKFSGLLPVELRHSTIGILGYGSIGREVARLLKPFGATIFAVKKDVMHPEDRGYSAEGKGDPHGEYFDRLYPIEALHSVLAASDFVVMALPLTHQTRNILDEVAFKAMKNSGYLINVGRGGLIDEQALIRAISTKQIAGAALDVFAQEPLAQDSPLWDLENVLITPHISGISQYLTEETLSLFIENLKRYLSDLPLLNLVDLDQGY